MLSSIMFTHDDLDGAGCRVIFELMFFSLNKGVDFDIINCANNTISDAVFEALKKENYIGIGTEIFFADICPSIEVLQVLKERNHLVRIFDHHVTNFPAQNVFPDVVIEPTNAFGKMQSGTSLLYQYAVSVAAGNTYQGAFCHKSLTDTGKWGKLLGKFVDTIRAYDTYEFKVTGEILPKHFQTLFFLLGMERFCNKYLERFTSIQYPTEALILVNDMLFVSARMEFEQRAIDSLTIDDVYDVNVKGYRTAFLLTPIAANISEVAFQFLSKYPQFDMFASFTLARGGEFSYRTQKEDLDVGTLIAKPLDGGGHPKSAGSPLPDDLREKLLNALVSYINGNPQ